MAANLPPEVRAPAHEAAPDSSALMVHTGLAFDPKLSWRDLDWLRRRTRLPMIVKGVLHPDDAVRAVDRGADAVVVSNHGGRQLDGAVPSIAALQPVVAAVDGRCAVLLDSGVRSGVDVLRALALGRLRRCWSAGPLLWGLAVGGRAGARRVLTCYGPSWRMRWP